MIRRPIRHRAVLALAVSVGGACSGAQVHYLPATVVPAVPAGTRAALYLVGDAGRAGEGRDSVLAHLRRDLDRHTSADPDAPAVVAFLGDNIYDVGAREAFKAEDLAHLTAQADALGDSPSVRGVFLPGNHDWAKGARDAAGRDALRTQQQWLEEISGGADVGLLPDDGCAGPATVDADARTHLVFIDTEWLLRTPEDDCGGADAFYERLEQDLRDNRDRTIVLAAHHPMATGGSHGGNVGPLEHGPFVYFLAVKAGLSIQDLASGRYSAMLEGLRTAIAASGASPLAFVSGHDHSLQVIRMTGDGEPSYQLVSGSATNRSPAKRIAGTRYATDANGYMRIDFHAGGARVVVFAVAAPGGGVRPVFACALSTADSRADCPEAALAGS